MRRTFLWRKTDGREKHIKTRYIDLIKIDVWQQRKKTKQRRALSVQKFVRNVSLGSGKETALEISPLGAGLGRPGGLRYIPGFTRECPRCTGIFRKEIKGIF